MELPQTLLDRYHVSKPKSKKEESIPPPIQDLPSLAHL